MNSNGQTRNNNFVGDVYIDGNLNVSGTINGGGGGGGSVNNPMTEDLDAGQYSIHNVSEITGFGGILRTNIIDLQDNDIIHINELKGNSLDNKLYISGNVEILEDLNMTDKSILNINELKGNIEIKTSNLNLQDNSIYNVMEVRTRQIGPVDNLIELIGPVKMLNNNLDINSHQITNVSSIKAYSLTTLLHLDLIPSTEGKASQILARDPAFNPANPSTYKMVWQTPSAGFVTNPLSDTLIGNNNNLSTINIIETKTIINTTQLKLSTPVLTINNGIYLTPTAIGITGNITFTNPGASITAPMGVSLKVNDIYNDETTINVNTLTYFIGGIKTNSIGLNYGYDLNIIAPKTYLNGRLSNLFTDAKMGTRNVRTSLYKSFGNNTLSNDFNSLIPVSIDSVNGPTIGIPVLVANTMNTGDKIKITLNCSLSTSAGGDMNIGVYMGTTYSARKLQTAFIIPNTSTSLTTSIIEIELDSIVVNSVMTFDRVALLTMSKSNVSPRMIIGSSTNVINQINPTQDNYIYIFGSVSNIIGIATITILGQTIEHY